MKPALWLLLTLVILCFIFLELANRLFGPDIVFWLTSTFVIPNSYIVIPGLLPIVGFWAFVAFVFLSEKFDLEL